MTAGDLLELHWISIFLAKTLLSFSSNKMAVKVVYCSLFFVILSELRSMIIGTKQIQPQTMLKYTKQMIAGATMIIDILKGIFASTSDVRQIIL